jgi:hypothetical protein
VVPVRLCASARVMRMQPLPDPRLQPHFQLFALVTAGRAADHLTFELEALREHLAVYLELFVGLSAHGFRFEEVFVEISDTELVTRLLRDAGADVLDVRKKARAHNFGGSKALLEGLGLSLPKGRFAEVADVVVAKNLRARLEKIEREVIAPLSALYPAAIYRFDLSRLEGLGYYAGPCLRISATNHTGETFPLADGGFLRWTQALLSDRRERMLASGIGTDLVCTRYRGL